MLFLCCQNGSSPYHPSLWRKGTKSTSNLSGFCLKTMDQPVVPEAGARRRALGQIHCLSPGLGLRQRAFEKSHLSCFPEWGARFTSHYQQRPLKAQDYKPICVSSSNWEASSVSSFMKTLPPPLLSFIVCTLHKMGTGMVHLCFQNKSASNQWWNQNVCSATRMGRGRAGSGENKKWQEHTFVHRSSALNSLLFRACGLSKSWKLIEPPRCHLYDGDEIFFSQRFCRMKEAVLMRLLQKLVGSGQINSDFPDN